jgi:gamma-glutamylcysteine synthetase
MLNRQQVHELLEERLVEPTRVERPLYAGVELEFPLVNLAERPVDFVIVHSLTERFCAQFSFVPLALDNHGNIYSVGCPQTDDTLSYDCSYNNLEFSFGRVDDLCEVHQRFARYYRFIQEELAAHNHTLTGLGINPHRSLNRHEPLPNGRYRMLYRFLQSAALQPQPNHFHTHYDFGMFTSASQVQIDVTSDALISTLHAHELLEPLKAALFANSVLEDRGVHYLCARDMLWEDSMHGQNPRNVGAFGVVPHSVEELLGYIATQSIFCSERDGRYLSFTPTPIVEFLAAPQFEGEYFEDGEWHRVPFVPQERDVAYLRTYKFSDLTFRGTIEYRSCCCQPAGDALSVAAFHLGIAGASANEQLIELLAGAQGLPSVLVAGAPSPDVLRRLLVRRDWPASLDRAALKRLLLEVLGLACAGLAARGRGEEHFLNPLYERAERLENPAQRLIRLQTEGQSPEQIIHRYAAL